MTKRGKGFGAALASGLSGERRALDNRFAAADEEMAGREGSLLAPKAEPPSAAVLNVEHMAHEGRATLRNVTLPLDVLDDNPLNSRTFYSEDVIKARSASIDKYDQLSPSLVTPSLTTPGRYTLLDGHYRKRALKYSGKPTMQCLVVEGIDKVDFYKLSRTANAEREQESILDEAFGYKKLMDSGLAKTDEEVGAIAGESRQKVNKMLLITELPQDVLDEVLKKPAAFGMVACYELTLYLKATSLDKTVSLARRIADEGLSVKKIETIRKAAEQGGKQPKEMSRQHKVRAAGAEIGTLKDWDSGRIVLDITVANPAEREQHLEALKRQFGVE